MQATVKVGEMERSQDGMARKPRFARTLAPPGIGSGYFSTFLTME